MTRIAIIGAGLAGLSLAHRLAGKAGITLFEKSRGVSGRLSTRRIADYEFDHGAQFFTARSQAFQQFLKPYMREGLVTEWWPRVTTLSLTARAYKRDWFEPHYVAVPGMNALAKALARGLDIQLNTPITGLERQPRGWVLNTADTTWPEPFDWVISTAPLPQTRALLAPHLGNDEYALDESVMSPCFTLMLGLASLPPVLFDAARVNDSCLQWIMVNSSKPGRAALPAMVIQSVNGWAEKHRDADKEWVAGQMLAEVERQLQLPLPGIEVQSLHHWLYARVETALKADYLLDLPQQLAGCGDWCVNDRVEGAFLSAMSLSASLEQRL